MDLRERRELANGFGDSLSRAVEFVATPLLFGWVGHVLDGRLGTGLVLTVTLGVLAAVGMFLKMWFAYVEAMKAHDRRSPWGHA